MGLGGVISNLQSIGAKLLPFVSSASAQAPSGSSSASTSRVDAGGHGIEADLQRLMKMLKGIEAKLYDAEERVIRDHSVSLWLEELRQVAHDAEDLLDDYHYEVLRAQVETRDISPANPHKRKQIQVPDNMFNKIKEIMGRFDEIESQRRELRLFHEDAPRHANTELQIFPTSHFVIESNIFGREQEKEHLINLLSSECYDGNIISVVTIVGVGGLGKTTLAQLVYNDQRIEQMFDKFGWVCVSEDFNVERLTRELVECITKEKFAFINLSVLQEELCEAVRGKRVFLVLDDVWNENTSLWEKLRAPFASATSVKILVTTRNEVVAQMMQTTPTVKLGYLSKERCWQLFQHYAFGQVNHNEGSEMVKIGMQIMKKCGMLPLAVKSIASLLRHEKDEESWREILESELWEAHASNEIFLPLQISYARLPTYLKPCLLYSSVFPKDYNFDIKELVQLWISQGYIKSNEKNDPKRIGRDYVKQLWQRSFLEGNGAEKEFHLKNGFYKLHDVIHDLARLNSGNGCYSIEAGKVPDFPESLYHLYVDRSVKLLKPLPSFKVTDLRTLIIMSNPEHDFGPFDYSKAQNLRALKLLGPSQVYELKFFTSVDNIKHLRYLYLIKFSFEMLPECVCSLYNLKTLTIEMCKCLQELPKSIGNLISLEELTITGSSELRGLPESFCQLQTLKKLEFSLCDKLEELPSDIGKLTKLQTLSISTTSIRCLPPSFKFTESLKIKALLNCKTIDILKDVINLRGNLCLDGLGYMPSLTGVECANLARMSNLDCLELSWIEGNRPFKYKALHLVMERKVDQNIYNDGQNHFATLSSLQPHPNLRELCISCYRGVTFPGWISNSISCPSLLRIKLSVCSSIEFLPFGGLGSLKYLNLFGCARLQFLGADSLPPELHELTIEFCRKLKSVSGMCKLKSLAKLSIKYCFDLLLVMDVEPSHADLMKSTIEPSYRNSLLGVRNLDSLRSFEISCSPKLHMFTDEMPPVGSCKTEVSYCPGIKDWCLRHKIAYKD